MDRIGGFTFVRLSRPPDRVGPQWQIRAQAGADGVSLWNMGVRGAPFQVRSEAVALNFVVGRTFFLQYKQLEYLGTVPVYFGTLEPEQLYKVLRVEQQEGDVIAIPRAHIARDNNWYTCLVFATWTLLPLDPFVQRP